MNKSIWLIVVMISLLSCRNKSSTEIGSKITLQARIIDLGKIKTNSKIQKSFWIKNNGAETLKILNIKGSCSCTKAKINKKSIVAGKKGILSFTYNAPSNKGIAINTICIRNNSENPFCLVKIRAEMY